MKRAAAVVLALAAAGALAQPRPQLTPEQAARHTVADYLAQGPVPWVPEPVSTAVPDFVVAADGSGTHRTVQAAIDALPARGSSTRRHVIAVKPGTYREIVCALGKAPFTLRGEAADASAVTIVEGRWHARLRGDEPANPCAPVERGQPYGTPGSTSVAIASDDVQLAHLTIANDAMDAVFGGQRYPEGAGESGGAQAVALTVAGDRIRLENVRLLGHQDTLYARRPAGGGAARVYVHASFIAGDVDFIFGDATLVIDDCLVLSRAGRRAPGNGGHVLAPSTAHDQRLGFLVVNSRLLAEAGVAAGSVSLGRAWDHGVARGAWQAGVSPNGQALVRDSLLGPHLAPWAASTSRRPFAADGPQANRMAEFGNTALPDDGSRELLPLWHGWGAWGLGTRGGAEAQPEHVFDVRDREGLFAALAADLGGRPRIVRLHARVDLGVEEAAVRDPAFDRAAFERTYDPATWGRQPPAGPLEEARQRSARRQAQAVTVRVPSRTTLVGVAPGAGLGGGMLLLENVRDVVVRGLQLSDAYDHFPAWDPNDNANGEWNSEYDTLSLRNAVNVWVDHCSFDDGTRPDAAEPRVFGRPLMRHDGLLDVTRGSDLVTVSWNHFREHDKTSLVGSSDRATTDEGRLRVSYHHNRWQHVKERAPRVRFGQVHVFENLYEPAAEGPYAGGYSVGVGHRSRLLIEDNAWDLGGRDAAGLLGSLLRVLGGTAVSERGSWVDGRPADLLAAWRAAHPGAALAADSGWAPPRPHPRLGASAVAAAVRAGAGAPIPHAASRAARADARQ